MELAYPGSHFFKGDSLRYLQVITAHGLTMVFFVVIPLVFGSVGNFFIPYHVGSKDVAFPRLNSLGFWFLPAGFLLLSKPAFIRSSFFRYFDKPSFYYDLLNNNFSGKKNTFNVSNFNDFYYSWTARKSLNYFNYNNYSFIPYKYYTQFFNLKDVNSKWNIALNVLKIKQKKLYIAKCSNSILTMSGWTFITPFSGKTKFTGLGSQDLAIISVIFSGVSTTVSFTNLLITRRTLSMPGLRNRRTLIPFLTITLLLTMRMLTLITPVLGAAMLMLLLDRHWKTTFFDYSYGGDVILFHHLFWFFGHPEVYVVIIPVFGIINMLLPYYNTRRIAAKNHLIWATYIMGYMGFLVWGHHMYLIGLDHRSRSLYSTITVMISLPAIVKIVNWTLTILNGSLKYDLSFLFVLTFFFFFLCGGLTGMWLSHVGLNVYVHDTFYVVAHFHFLFSASSFSAIFAGIYYYYYILFNVSFTKIFGYLQLFYWTCGQWLTFLPLFWIGYNGLPRRYHDYPISYASWHGAASVGHVLTLISIFFFLLLLLDSHIEQKIPTSTTYGIPRFNKRINYYLFKIIYINKINLTLNNFLNLKNHNLFFKKSLFYEHYKFLIHMLYGLNLLINIIFLINLTLIAGVIPLIERKYLSLIQRRVGPNFVGYKGRLQFIADALKLFLKGAFMPYNVNKVVFFFSPSLILSFCYLFWINVLWLPNLIFFELEYNLLYLNLLSIFIEFFIILTGFFSKNKYAFLSSIRSAVKIFSLELLFNLFLLLIVIFSKSFNFHYILILQEEYWFVWNLLLIFNLIFLMLYLETSRAPFDLNEAESELITGFHIEYGSFFFGIYYLAEYFHLFFFCAVLNVLIF
jgi:heme/copper-type cytochrome/quinol oxidase subunit 1/NADH:ubiquinone oxidoreductase subunit H